MLAAVFEGPGQMAVREVERPRCSEDGMVVKVEACAICGTDSRIFAHGQANVKVPQIMGHEIAGIVDEVGPLAKGFQVGDRVAIRPDLVCGQCPACTSGRQNFCANAVAFGYDLPGGFAEYVHVPGRALRVGTVLRVPEGVDLDEISIFEPFGCVVNAQEMVKPTVGDTVVIIGAGPVGCMHLALAKMHGASKTIIADVLGSRLELASRFGPSVCVDSSAEDLTGRVMVETAEAGADVVIVACSSGRAQEQALEMVGRGGRVSYFAGLPHEKPYINFNSNLVHYRQMAVYGVTGANWRQHEVAFNLLATKQVDGGRLVTHRIALKDIMEGFRIAREGEGLKVVIKPHMKA